MKYLKAYTGLKSTSERVTVRRNLRAMTPPTDCYHVYPLLIWQSDFCFKNSKVRTKLSLRKDF